MIHLLYLTNFPVTERMRQEIVWIQGGNGRLYDMRLGISSGSGLGGDL